MVSGPFSVPKNLFFTYKFSTISGWTLPSSLENFLSTQRTSKDMFSDIQLLRTLRTMLWHPMDSALDGWAGCLAFSSPLFCLLSIAFFSRSHFDDVWTCSWYAESAPKMRSGLVPLLLKARRRYWTLKTAMGSPFSPSPAVLHISGALERKTQSHRSRTTCNVFNAPNDGKSYGNRLRCCPRDVPDRCPKLPWLWMMSLFQPKRLRQTVILSFELKDVLWNINSNQHHSRLHSSPFAPLFHLRTHSLPFIVSARAAQLISQCIWCTIVGFVMDGRGYLVCIFITHGTHLT